MRSLVCLSNLLPRARCPSWSSSCPVFSEVARWKGNCPHSSPDATVLLCTPWEGTAPHSAMSGFKILRAAEAPTLMSSHALLFPRGLSSLILPLICFCFQKHTVIITVRDGSTLWVNVLIKCPEDLVVTFSSQKIGICGLTRWGKSWNWDWPRKSRTCGCHT